ncbi:uncharacterized protein LOC113289630 [Papaver somniferum]|uniref:uncharacterized protein LOC113289630 n=1 Tax=Papaver somniferum TaxID=3469 RepID=UPI000E6F8A88|nr:uncharacterized protein LOC113289630 [Papaver somniferum]
MHIWPDASTKVSKTQKTLLDVFFYLPIWFAEHTKIMVPKALPEDKFVPRAGRWNLKQICTALLKNMDESKYVFDQKFVEPYTEKEKVVLNMSEEGGIMFLEEGREDKYEELRMTIKSSWKQMQKMDCNNEKVVPKMQEMLNKIYFKAYPDIQPDRIHKEFDDSVQLDDDAKLDVPMSHQEAPEDDSSSAQVKKDDDAKVDVPMSHQEAPEDDSNSAQVKNDKRVEFDDSVQLDDDAKVDVPMSHQEAPEDDSNLVQVKNDKRVELVFGDDVENMDVADILIGLKETPRLQTSATAINPEPTPIVTETTSSAPIAPEAKVADESQEANHTAPETTSSASPKPASEDPNVTVPEDPNVTKPYLVFERNFKKRKASESNVQKDDILAENKKAKDEHIAARSAEIIKKFEEEGFYKGNSMDGNGKTSLEKVTRELAKTIEKLQEDGESKPSTAKIDEFALATSRNRNNIQVEASSVVTKEKETLSSELRVMNHPERFLNEAHDEKRILLILDLNGVLGSFGYRKIS